MSKVSLDEKKRMDAFIRAQSERMWDQEVKETDLALQRGEAKNLKKKHVVPEGVRKLERAIQAYEKRPSNGKKLQMISSAMETMHSIQNRAEAREKILDPIVPYLAEVLRHLSPREEGDLEFMWRTVSSFSGQVFVKDSTSFEKSIYKSKLHIWLMKFLVWSWESGEWKRQSFAEPNTLFYLFETLALQPRTNRKLFKETKFLDMQPFFEDIFFHSNDKQIVYHCAKILFSYYRYGEARFEPWFIQKFLKRIMKSFHLGKVRFPIVVHESELGFQGVGLFWTEEMMVRKKFVEAIGEKFQVLDNWNLKHDLKGGWVWTYISEMMKLMKESIGIYFLDEREDFVIVSDHLQNALHRMEREKLVSESKQICAACWMKEPKDVKFLKCARCKVNAYCSKDCQIRDWSFHKKSCNRWTK